SRPSVQRDGLLLRVPLVGGRLNADQLGCLADVAIRYGNGIVELTNRGNLQLRGLAQPNLQTVFEVCRAVGLGEASASLVTIAPCGEPEAGALREASVQALDEVDPTRLSPKFVVHVDAREGSTADRPADLSVRCLANDEVEASVRGHGVFTC